MLGRKDFSRKEFNGAKTTMDRQLAAYRKLAQAVDASSDPGAIKALKAFEPLFFNNMTLALDRYFVHRVRMVTGKDGNPLNEVELVTESLMGNGGEFRGNNVIKLVPAESVLKLEQGDRISLSRAEFERLYRAFLSDLEAKFVTAG
jgi:hypothetical protein